MEKIEFYKNRTLSERFSVSVDFLKQNWKVLYKNVLIVALPLGIIAAYFAQYYQQISSNIFNPVSNTYFNPFFAILYVLAVMVLNVFLTAMSGAVMIKYGEGKLTPATGWSNLSNTFFSLSGNTFAISLTIAGAIIVPLAVIAFLFGSSARGSGWEELVVGAVFMIIVIVILFALTPSLSLVLYPAFFSGTGNRESIKIAFGMGFRNWGNMIVTLILAGIVYYVIIIIFSIPNTIMIMFAPEEVTVLTFIFSFIAFLGQILTYPVFFVFVAFQYFSIVEQEQGLSLQSKVDEFENL